MENKYHLAKEIANRAFPEVKLISQSANLWQGDFPLPDAVADYYREFGAFDFSIENYGNPFFLPSLESLWKFQSGYRFHGLTNERVEDWQDDWLVIADEGGNPLIYSIEAGNILFDHHGQGVWNPGELFLDLSSMATSLLILGEIVVSAGDSFTDENCYINERFIVSAKERLTQILNSEAEAELVLETFGWSN